MGAKITVMSGSRQGQAFTVTKNGFSVGNGFQSDLQFDLTVDPDCEGQQISILLQDDKWYLHNSSRRSLYLNHDVVKESTGLRSGDLIRLSLDGPDLLFEIHSSNELQPPSTGSEKSQSKPVPIAEKNGSISKKRQGVEKSEIDSPENSIREMPNASVGLASDQENKDFITTPDVRDRGGRVRLSSRGRSRRTSKTAMVVGILSVVSGAVAGISIAIVLLWVVWKKDPLGILASAPRGSEQAHASDLDPGNQALDSSAILGAGGSNVAQSRATGEQSAESAKSSERNQDGKRNSAGSQATANGGTLRFRPVERQQVDLSKGSFLSLDLSEYLIPRNASGFSYRLSEDAPEGIEVDSDSGLITWEIPRAYGGNEVKINVSVSSSTRNAQTVAVSFDAVLFFSDPWDLIEQQLLGSVYLIAAKTNPGDRYLVLGTACAISDRQLLSSATVVSGMIRAEQRGWSVLAMGLPFGRESNLREVSVKSRRLHRMYLDAFKKSNEITRRTQQAFFDLAIIETNEKLDSHVNLGQLKGGDSDAMNVACLGFSVNGNLTSDLSDLRPEFTSLDLLGTFPPENASLDAGRPPLLLEMEGEIPVHSFGGLIVNSMADVVGVYCFEGDSDPDEVAPPVHYAAEVLVPKLFLDGRGTDLWVSETEVDMLSVLGGE